MRISDWSSDVCSSDLFDQLRLSDKPVTPRESRDSLRRLRFFATFSDEEINEILGASQMVSYSDGDVLMREGELDSSFFIIAPGAAEVQKHGKRPQQLEKGACLGEIGFLVKNGSTAPHRQTLGLGKRQVGRWHSVGWD